VLQVGTAGERGGAGEKALFGAGDERDGFFALFIYFFFDATAATASGTCTYDVIASPLSHIYNICV